MKKLKESDIQKAIMDYLQIKGWVVVKINNVGIRTEHKGWIRPRQLGISDLLCCRGSDGKFIAIEVKRHGNTLSDHQAVFLDQVRRARGEALVAYSLDDVINYLNGNKNE